MPRLRVNMRAGLGFSDRLSITRQCKLLGVNRSGVYYTPRAVPEADLQIMHRIDQLHLEHLAAAGQAT